MQNKKILIAGGCEVMIKVLPYLFLEKGFQPTLVIPDNVKCDGKTTQGIEYVRYRKLPEDLKNVLNEPYDYLLISGESKELSNDVLLQMVQFLTKNVNVKYKIGFISQSSVREHSGFDKAQVLLDSENWIKNCSRSFIIFKPSLYMELLHFFIRGNQITLIDDQHHPVHWVSGNEAAQCVRSYMLNNQANNQSVYIYGPEKYSFKDALTIYSSALKKNMRFDKVTIGMFKSFARFSNNEQMFHIAEMLDYYSSFHENGNYKNETNAHMHQTQINLAMWANQLTD